MTRSARRSAPSPDELLLGEDGQHLEDHAAGPQLRQPEVAERVGMAPLTLVLDAQQQIVVASAMAATGCAPAHGTVVSRPPRAAPRPSPGHGSRRPARTSWAPP